MQFVELAIGSTVWGQHPPRGYTNVYAPADARYFTFLGQIALIESASQQMVNSIDQNRRK